MKPMLIGFLKIKISLLMDHLHTSAVPVDVIESGVEFSLPCQHGMQTVKGNASQIISTLAAIGFSSSRSCVRLAEKSFFGYLVCFESGFLLMDLQVRWTWLGLPR